MTRTLFALAVGWEKLSRAHASPMNCYGGEFKGWTKDEARLFSQKLLAIIQRRDLIAISCGIRVDDFFEVFTENNRKTDMGVVYSLCMKQVMVELAHALDYLPDHKVSIVHDQGNWDADANQAYTAMRDDPRWPLRDRFFGIAPNSWQQDIGLQAADLIAYETFKHLSNKLFKGIEGMRPALRALIPTMPLYAKYWDKPVLVEFKKLLDAAHESVSTGIPEASNHSPST